MQKHCHSPADLPSTLTFMILGDDSQPDRQREREPEPSLLAIHTKHNTSLRTDTYTSKKFTTRHCARRGGRRLANRQSTVKYTVASRGLTLIVMHTPVGCSCAVCDVVCLLFVSKLLTTTLHYEFRSVSYSV